jgi:hypothetical protein
LQLLSLSNPGCTSIGLDPLNPLILFPLFLLLFLLELREYLVKVINIDRGLLLVLILLIPMVSLVIVVASLQPPVFIQTLTVKEHEPEDSTVIRLIHLLRDMAEVESKDFVAR